MNLDRLGIKIDRLGDSYPNSNPHRSGDVTTWDRSEWPLFRFDRLRLRLLAGAVQKSFHQGPTKKLSLAGTPKSGAGNPPRFPKNSLPWKKNNLQMTQNSEMTCLLELELRLLQADVFGVMLKSYYSLSFIPQSRKVNKSPCWIDLDSSYMFILPCWGSIIHRPFCGLHNFERLETIILSHRPFRQFRKDKLIGSLRNDRQLRLITSSPLKTNRLNPHC